MTTPGLLGIDGGGTSTTAWLADLDGRVLGRGRSGPSNMKVVGGPTARENLDRAVRLAFDDAGLGLGPVSVACLGLAGFDRPEDKRWLDLWAVDEPWAGRMIYVNDGDLVIAAGTAEGWGIGLVAGTGSIAVGRSPDGRSVRSGGWGPLIGDEGSGYAVALAGLRRVVRLADGRMPPRSSPDLLTGRLLEAVGAEDPSGLVSAIYGAGFDRARLASLAPVVVEVAGQDPALVAEILEPAGHELAEMVASVARQIGPVAGPLPLAMTGSFLLNSPPVSLSLLARLAQLGFNVQSQAVPHPVEGALVLARRALTV